MFNPVPTTSVRRSRFFVDSKVQTALVIRTAMYWLYTILAVTLMLCCARVVFGPELSFQTQLDNMWYFYGDAILASTLLLPIVLVDVVKISNRFVGPLVRFRRAMRALAAGESVRPLKYRDGDYWCDMADEFNALAAHVEQLRAAAAQKQPSSESSEPTPAAQVE